MLITGELSKEDFAIYLAHFVNTSKAIRKRIITTMILYFVLTFIAFKIIISDFSLWYFLYYILLLVIVFLVFPIRLRKRMGKVFAEKLERVNLLQQVGSYAIRFYEEGIELESKDNEKLQISWEDVERVHVDMKHYYIYYGQRGIIVPIRDVDSRKEEFWGWVNQQVEPDHITDRSSLKSKTKPRIIAAFVLGVAFVALFSYQAYQAYAAQPHNDFIDASHKVTALFEETPDVEAEQGTTNLKIKSTTTQEQIDEAKEAIAKIDTSKNRYKIYEFPLLALVVYLAEAQKQIDERENE